MQPCCKTEKKYRLYNIKQTGNYKSITIVPNVQSKFEKSTSTFMNSSLRLSSLDFQRAYERWKQKIAQLKRIWPPQHLQISPNSAAYMAKRDWVARDFMVFASVCESARVFEVLNSCPLLDVEVVESLVALRREHLIQIH